MASATAVITGILDALRKAISREFLFSRFRPLIRRISAFRHAHLLQYFAGPLPRRARRALLLGLKEALGGESYRQFNMLLLPSRYSPPPCHAGLS